MKNSSKIFSLVITGLMALTLVFSVLSAPPRIPPLQERAAEEAPNYVV